MENVLAGLGNEFKMHCNHNSKESVHIDESFFLDGSGYFFELDDDFDSSEVCLKEDEEQDVDEMIKELFSSLVEPNKKKKCEADTPNIKCEKEDEKETFTLSDSLKGEIFSFHQLDPNRHYLPASKSYLGKAEVKVKPSRKRGMNWANSFPNSLCKSPYWYSVKVDFNQYIPEVIHPKVYGELLKFDTSNSSSSSTIIEQRDDILRIKNIQWNPQRTTFIFSFQFCQSTHQLNRRSVRICLDVSKERVFESSCFFVYARKRKTEDDFWDGFVDERILVEERERRFEKKQKRKTLKNEDTNNRSIIHINSNNGLREEYPFVSVSRSSSSSIRSNSHRDHNSKYHINDRRNNHDGGENKDARRNNSSQKKRMDLKRKRKFDDDDSSNNGGLAIQPFGQRNEWVKVGVDSYQQQQQQQQQQIYNYLISKDRRKKRKLNQTTTTTSFLM